MHLQGQLACRAANSFDSPVRQERKLLIYMDIRLKSDVRAVGRNSALDAVLTIRYVTA
jgi:hypothetical protein